MDGVVRIPKTVFESNSTALSSDVVATVRRIDGTVEELKRMAPDNPNFQPRKPTPGRVKAINKDEVSAWPSIGNALPGSADTGHPHTPEPCTQALIAFHKRKGLPLPAELQSKADEMEKQEQEEALRVQQRAKRFGLPVPGNKSGKGNSGGKGGVGGESAEAAADLQLSEEDKAKMAARAARFLVGGGASAASAASMPANPKRERPKGGVKVLSGVEGALKGGSRAGEGAADGPQAKRQAAV